MGIGSRNPGTPCGNHAMGPGKGSPCHILRKCCVAGRPAASLTSSASWPRLLAYCLALCASFLMVSLVRELSDISVLAMHFMSRACSLYMSPMSYMPLPPGGLVLCYQKTAPVAGFMCCSCVIHAFCKRGYGAMAARLTPDQKVGHSNRSGLIFWFLVEQFDSCHVLRILGPW